MSQIVNNEFEDISGLLTMKIMKRTHEVYVDYDTILEDSLVTVPAQGVVALDLIWNPLGWEIPESGRYRVVVEFDVDGEVYSSEYGFVASN